MKKVYVSGLYRQEILDTHITRVQDYVEEAVKVFAVNLLGATNGVINGLLPTITAGNQSVTITSGIVFQDGLYGELIASTGFVVSKPVSGMRTDVIVASYQEVLTDFASGFILLDPATRIEQIQTLATAEQGQVKLEQLINTTASAVPANKIAICEIQVDSSGIISLSDVRKNSVLQKTAASTFNNLFFGSM